MNTPICGLCPALRRGRAPPGCTCPATRETAFLGCEPWDITEIHGADALYEAGGHHRGERGTTPPPCSAPSRTFYSTEGSSQCIRAMLYLALTWPRQRAPGLVVAARNVHRAFVSRRGPAGFGDRHGCWPEESRSLCGCPVSPGQLERDSGGAACRASGGGVSHQPGLSGRHGGHRRSGPGVPPARHPAAGGQRPWGLSAVSAALPATPWIWAPTCAATPPTRPCRCSPAGAYLHICPRAPRHQLANVAKTALALFGSTSPSYLTLASLDLCNRYLAEGYPSRLAEAVERLAELRERLTAGWAGGWSASDPLRVTVAAPRGVTGHRAGRAAAAPGRGVRVRRPGLPGADGHPGEHPGGIGPGGRGPGAVPRRRRIPPSCPWPGGSAPAPSARRPLPPGKPWMPARTPWGGFAAFPQWAARRPSPLPFRGSASLPRPWRCLPTTA